MIARLVISPSLERRGQEVKKILAPVGLTNPHPDLLYFPSDSKLGVEQARIIREHFSLKPYSAKGRGVVLEDATNLTTEAQNALLKTLEEPPANAVLILGASSDAKFLPTILSRCQVIRVEGIGNRVQGEKYTADIEKLIESNIEQRFEYIEELKDREEFLHQLTNYFHKKLPSYADFSKELLLAEQWAAQNVNIRAILEYLMLVMPQKL